MSSVHCMMLFWTISYRLVQAYGPNFLKHPMSTPFFGGRPWNLAQVFYVSLPTRHRMFFFLPVMFFYFLGYLSPARCKNSGDFFFYLQRLGRGSYNTCENKQNVSPKIGLGIWDFSERSLKNKAWPRIHLVSVWINFGRLKWLDIGPTQSGLLFLRETFYSLGVPRTSASRKKWKKWNIATETPDSYWHFEGPWLVGTYFRRYRQP